ncbi:MAG TPA: TetR family transcriptional regulator [Myxococcota bacterium]|nr:TetR family transcriptional regulator [Myxococcota bacterium]
MSAALEAFADHGFAGATTRAIAERAGVALAALPYHFETKEALWRAAADRVFSQLVEQFQARIRGLEGVDAPIRLRLLLRDYVLFAAAHPELHRFMLREGAVTNPRLRWLVRTHVEPLFRYFRSLITEGQEKGFVRGGRPEHLYYAMIGAASMPYAVAAEFRLLTGSDSAAKKLVEEHADTVARLFFEELE